MPSLHNRLAASASPRWTLCTGSVALIEKLKEEGKIPERSDTYASQLGTLCHEVLEYCVIRGIDPVTLSKKLVKEITPDELKHIQLEHYDLLNVNGYWEYIEDLKPKFDETFAERRYDLTDRYGIDFGGTADVTQAETEGTLHIGDYKNGRTLVEHTNNSQLRVYALGAYHELNTRYQFQDVMMSIGQPNGTHPEGPIRHDIIETGELLEWEGDTLKPAIESIKTGKTCFVAGEKQCEWCDAQKFCETYAEWSTDIAEADFSDFTSPESLAIDITLLTDEQAERILDKKPFMLKLFEKLEERALETAQKEKTGRFGKTYGLDRKMGNRFYIPQKQVISKLKRNRIPLYDVLEKPPEPEKKVIGITKLEAFLRVKKKWSPARTKRFMDTVTDRQAGKAKLVKLKEAPASEEFAEFVETEKPKTSSKAKKPKKLLRRRKK